MTAAGWLAIALAVAMLARPSALPGRALALVDAGRVAGPAQQGVPTRIAWRRLAPWVIGALVVGVGVAGGPALAVAAAAVGGVVLLAIRDVSRSRAAVRAHADLLAAVRLLEAELRAGARPGGALRAAAEVAPAHAQTFRAAADAASAGADAGDVLRAGTGTGALGVAWQIGVQTGAALAEVLADIARDLTAVDEQRRAVAVALSGPRSSAAVLTGLPVVGIALGAAMGAHPVPFLVGPGAGRVVCAVGVVLDVAGVLWIRRIVHRAQAVP